MKIEITKFNDILKIRYDGLMHLAVKESKIIAIHSYIDKRIVSTILKDCEEDLSLYVIEYHTTNGIVKTEYEDRKVWEQILTETEILLT